MKRTTEQLEKLENSLKKRDDQYDPRERLLAVHKGGGYDYNTYLRNTTVHPTRESLSYAVALLDTGDPEREERAEAIVRRVLEFQDADPDSDSFGIWAKYLEEPLAKAPYIDRNWADFLSVNLLHVALYHRHRLPDDLNRGIETAVRRAAQAIRTRNVGPGYTNIAIMGTYVTLVAAELYGDPDLLTYALERLRRFHEHTMHHGALSEYNSPTYTMVALRDLAKLRLHAQNPQAKPLIEKIYHMAWQELAQHFHPPTRQWAGPYSRAYGDLSGESLWAFIERNTSGRIEWGVAEPGEADTVPAPCPPDLEAFFEPLQAPRSVVKTFHKGDAEKGEPPIVGTTYLSPAFALGSINFNDMWNQRSNLLAHWGTPQQPSYLRLRFLHDGYDFQTVHFWGAQREGSVLAALALATDGGDKHPSLDKIKDATVQAKDFRLRWEFGGAAKNINITAPADLAAAAHLRFGDLHVQIAAPYARFGEFVGRWEAGRTEDAAFLDVVFYNGPERAFKLDELEVAAAGFALQMTEGDAPLPPVRAAAEKGRLRLQWRDMALSVPLHPDAQGALRRDAVSQAASEVPSKQE